MVDKYTTKVTKRYAKTFDDGGTSHSFRTEATGDTWLRANKNEFKGVMDEGNTVEIEVERTTARGGKENVYLNSAKLVSGGAAKPAAGAAAGGGNGGGGRGHYSDATQQAIQYQAARNSAIEYLKLVVGANACKLPEKEASRLKALDALLDSYTAQFYADTSTLGAVKRAVGDEEEEVKAETEAGGEDD